MGSETVAASATGSLAVAPRDRAALCELAGAGTQIGCAVDGMLPQSLHEHELAVLCRHFNVLTPENCMKPASVQPREGEFHFDAADALVAFAQARGLDVIGHCLVWHQQCPNWFFESRGKPAGRDAVLARMRTHIRTVMRRFSGKIRGYDVVNEAIADDAGFLRQTRWLRSVGKDYIEQAFRFAHEADPDAELYYNDFNVELPEKRRRTVKLLRQLLDADCRVDAVGIEGHWILDQVPFEAIEEAILEYHSLGLKVMITELDIDVVDRPDCGADVSLHHAYSVKEDIYRDACPPAVLEKQAAQYAQLFDLFARHRDKISRISFWGLHDGRSWLNYWPGRRTNHPLLFDRRCEPKAAFRSVVKALTH